MKRLKQDIRDDWFPDFLEFKDLFKYKEFCEDYFKTLDEQQKKYSPSNALHFDIPKPGFTIRYSSETNFIDRLVYQACIDKIAEELDKIHSNSIYSHRVNTNWTDKTDKYLFKYPVEEWNKFLMDAKIELEKPENEVLLITDLSNYYESISIIDLKKTLNFQIDNLNLSEQEKKEFKKISIQIYQLLDRWCIPDTKRGIPQNRDASSFLSNIFLNPVDDIMLKSGFKYFRYMDDIRIVCRDKYEGRKALKLLVGELRKCGLNVNSKKTRILDLNNPKDSNEAKNSLQQGDKQIDQIEGFLKSRKPRGVQIAIPMLRKKTISLIESGGTLERHFRFCINRLERLVRIPELRENLDLEEITDAILTELINQPWSTDTFARYLISVPLSENHLEEIVSILMNDDKNIYEWQEYHIWRILINHRYKNYKLLTKARKNIQDKANNTPILCGSILYLCSVGDGNDRKQIVDNFKHFKDFLIQRTALIGIKDLDYGSFIKPSVENYLKDSLKGSYKVLKNNYSNIYCVNPSDLNYKDFYDELPEFIS